MEQQKQSLPTDIDSQILELTSNITLTLSSIAHGWKLLVKEVKAKEEKIK